MTTKTDDTVAELLHHYPELAVCLPDLMSAYKLMQTAFTAGGKVLLCGNGGSAADCEHFVGELMKNFETNRPIDQELRQRLNQVAGPYGNYLADRLQRPLPALSLASQTALMTAISNDIAADMVFAQQVLGYGQPHDILIGISTSGNSVNVHHALRTARAIGLPTIGFTGLSGLKLQDLCDVVIAAPYDQTARIQECHLAMYHVLSRLLEKNQGSW